MAATTSVVRCLSISTTLRTPGGHWRKRSAVAARPRYWPVCAASTPRRRRNRSRRRATDARLAFRAMASFPQQRPRRLRRTAALRRLVRETRLSPDQLVLPLFVRSGKGIRKGIESMPGVAQTSIDEMLVDAREAVSLGLGGVLLFGIPDTKDATGSSAWDDNGPVQQAVRLLKKECPAL